MRKGYATCPEWSSRDWNPGSWPLDVTLLAMHAMTLLEGNMSQVLRCHREAGEGQRDNQQDRA